MKYTVNYFIKKFEAIPDNLWTVQTVRGKRRSALGHCGFKEMKGWEQETEESKALMDIFNEEYWNVWDVNYFTFGDPRPEYSQYIIFKGLKTPKARILAALNHIKNKSKKK